MHKIQKFTFYAIIFVGIIALFWIGYIASKFRPVQDDYSFAAIGFETNPIDASIKYFLEANGGLTQSLYAYSLGWIVGRLPFEFAYLPFTLIFLFLIFFTIYRLWGVVCPDWPAIVKHAGAVVGTFSWILIVGFPLSDSRKVDLYSQFSFFAGSNRGIYFIICILLITFLVQNQRLFPRKFALLSLPTGLLLGLWNFGESLTIGFLALMGLFVARKIAQLRNQLLLISGGVFLGLFINWNSPGSQHRITLFPQLSFSQSVKNFGVIFNDVWSQTFGNFGLALALLFIVSFCVFASTQQTSLKSEFVEKRSKQSALNWWLVFLFSAMMMLELVLVAFGSSKSYFGQWHLYGLPVIFIGLFVSCGPIIAKEITRYIKSRDLLNLLFLAIIALELLASGITIRGLSSIAAERQSTWDAGESAPIGYIIDLEMDWIEESNRKLMEYRQKAGLDSR